MRPAAKLTTSAAEGLPRRRFTVAEVEAMVAAGVMEEDERVELIGGELVPMSPKGNQHEVVKSALLDRWFRVSARRVPSDPGNDLPPQRGHLSRARRRHLSASKRHRGLSANNVLLVVEIADSSLRYDIGRKAALYASFGIRELWVIDAVRLTTRVFREPAADGYGECARLRPCRSDSSRSSRRRRSRCGSTSWS